MRSIGIDMIFFVYIFLESEIKIVHSSRRPTDVDVYKVIIS